MFIENKDERNCKKGTVLVTMYISIRIVVLEKKVMISPIYSFYT